MTSSHTMARSLPVPLVVLLMTSLAPTTGSSSPSPPHSTQETPTDVHSVSQFHETHAHTANDITPTAIKRTSAEVTDEKFTAAIGGRSADVADRKLLRNTMAKVPSDNDVDETGELLSAALSKRKGQESSRNKLSHDDSTSRTDSLPGSCHMHTNAVIWPRQTNTQSHRHTRSIARQTTVNSTQAKTCTEKKVRLGDILTGRFTFGDRTWSKVANDFMGLSMYLAAQVIALCLPAYLLCVVCCGQVTGRTGSRRHKPPYDQRDKAFTKRRLVFTVLTILLSLLLIMAGVTVFVVSHNKESRDVTLNNVMAHVTRAFSTFVRRTTDVLRYSMATNFADFQESMKKSIGNFSERLVAAINNNIRQKLTATSPAVIEAVENGTLPAVQAVRTSITVTQDKYEQALNYLVMYADTRFEDKVLASDVYRSFNNIFNKWREFRKTIKWKLRAFLRHLQDKIFGEMKKSTLEATGINDLLRRFGEQHEFNTKPVEEGIKSLQRRISEKQDGIQSTIQDYASNAERYVKLYRPVERFRRYILATVSVFLAMSGAGCLLVAAIRTLCGPRSLDPSRVTEGHLLTHLAVNGIYIFLFITGWFLMIILTLVLVFISLTQQFTCREINSLHVFGNDWISSSESKTDDDPSSRRFNEVSNTTSDEQFFQNTLRACQTVTDFPTTLGVPVNARHDHRQLGVPANARHDHRQLGVPVNARHDHRDLGHTTSTAAPVVTTVTHRDLGHTTSTAAPVVTTVTHRDLGHTTSTAAPVVTTVTPTRDEGDGGTVVAVLQQAVQLINTYNAQTNFSFDFSVLEALGRMYSELRSDLQRFGKELGNLGPLHSPILLKHTSEAVSKHLSEQIGVLLNIERSVPKAMQALSVRVKENNERNRAFFANRSHLGKVVATVEASLTQESDNFTKSYLDNAEQTLVQEFAECTPLFGATTILLEDILCSYTEQSGWIWLGLGWLWFVLVPAIYLACVLLRFWQELLHVLDLHQHSCVRADSDLLVTDTAHNLGPSGVHDTDMDKTCDVINTTDTQSRVVEGPRDESNQLQPAMVGGANSSPASRGSAQSLHSATSQAKHRHTFRESYPSLAPASSLDADETHTQSCSDQSDTEMTTEDGTKEAQAVESRDRGVIDGVIGGRGVTYDPTQRNTDSRFSPDSVDVDWMTKSEEWTTDDPNHVTFHRRLQLGAERVLCDWETGASETDDDIIGYNLELTSSETTWLVVSPDEDGQDSTESILGD